MNKRSKNKARQGKEKTSKNKERKVEMDERNK